MKILDLLEKDIPRIERSRGQLKTSKKHRMLGQGLQGIAQQHGRAPNTVIKTANVYEDPPENDEYVQFIKLALDHQDNPFFPRIHNAKLVYDSRTASYKLVVTMEKLVELTGEKMRDAAKGMLSQLGIEHESVMSDVPNVRVAQEKSFGWLFKWFKNAENRQKAAQESNNPQFKEAMTLLNPYIEKLGQDLHGGNIMVRLTGHGPQLVIIDPFAYSG